MMRHVRTMLLACSLGLLLPLFVSYVHALGVGRFDQLSYMTFSQPVALPGVTVPAGEYIFRLPSRNTSRMVLQVLSKDGSQVYAMFHTRPTSRSEATAEPTVIFHESAAGAPRPIRAWFYAGERFGMEFAYPKEQAELIARDSSYPVLTTDWISLSRPNLEHVE